MTSRSLSRLLKEDEFIQPSVPPGELGEPARLRSVSEHPYFAEKVKEETDKPAWIVNE